MSDWFRLGVLMQLSATSRMVSLSASSRSVLPSQTSPMRLLLLSVWVVLAKNTQLSHASPTPSPSTSVWLALATVGQLSAPLRTPSRSTSPSGLRRPSQTSPVPLLLESVWSLEMPGQLSQVSPTRSPSVSSWLVLEAFGQLSAALRMVSESTSPSGLRRPSQMSPVPLLLASSWSPLAMVGQLSQASPRVSPSESVWVVLGVLRQLSSELMMVSPSTSPSG